MCKRLILALWICAVCAGCGTPPGAQTPPAPVSPAPAGGAAKRCPNALGPIEGPIVFNVGYDLVSMHDDGTHIQKLTTVPEGVWVRDPAWSPDGSTLAFTMSGPPSDQALFWLQATVICGIDRQTGRGRTLADSGQDLVAFAEPTWSANGHSLLVTMTEYQSDDKKQFVGATTSIAAVPIGGAKWDRLIADGASPALSQDGKQLAYVRTDPKTNRMTLMRADYPAGKAQPLTGGDHGIDIVVAPTWRPDGKEISFSGAASETTNGAPNPARRSLLERMLGVQVAAAHGVPLILWAIGLDGTGLHQLRDQPFDDPRIAWSPDGKRYVYSKGIDGLAMVTLATGREEMLTDQENYGRIAWGAFPR